MDKKKVIEILELYREIDGEAAFYLRAISDYESQYCSALDMPDCMAGKIEELKMKVKRLQFLKSEILQEVSRLRLKEKTIIFDYYIYGLKWEQVAEHTHYSDRQCKNIRDTAVEKLAERFKNNARIKEEADGSRDGPG